MLALAVRVAASLTSLGFVDQQYENVRVALSLAHGAGFADPFGIPTGPTAHIAPGYPLVLSAVYGLFGDALAGDTAKRVLACVMSSLSYAFLPLLARACSFQATVGITAGLFGAIFPLNRYEEISGNSESPWAALVLMLFFYCALTRPHLPMAAGLLFSPVTAPVFAALAIARRWWLPLTLAPLFLLPWAWRNHQSLGSWIWSRDNFGLELAISNRDQAAPALRENLRLGLHRAAHPSLSLAEADRVCYYGEVAYNRQKLDRAFAWMADHPARFIALSVTRIRLFWFPSAYFTVLVVLALFGVYRSPAAWVFASIWLLFPLVYYVVQYDPRYRHPLEWSILLAAAKGVDDLRRLLLPHLPPPHA